MKLYHTQKREDYNAFMDELESKGVKWSNGKKPHEFDGFKIYRSETVFQVSNKEILYFSMDFYKKEFNEVEIIEYKAEKDIINPSHYEFGGMEARHFLDKVFKYGEFEAWQAPYVSNAIEYIVRAPRKNGLDDFKKAQRNLEILIEKMEDV